MITVFIYHNKCTLRAYLFLSVCNLVVFLRQTGMHVPYHINFTEKLLSSWINQMDFYFMRNSQEMNLAINK